MKRFKFLASALLLTALAIGTYSFTSGKLHKFATTVCFQYTGPTTSTAPIHPNATDATTSTISGTNYTRTHNPADATLPNCTTPLQTLCGICFDKTVFPTKTDVNGVEIPDFGAAGNADLVTLIQNNYAYNGMGQGQTFTLHGKSVTIYWRAYALGE